jgi:hypothetical protein
MTESLASLIDVLRNTLDIVQEQTAYEKLGIELDGVELELAVEATVENGVDVSVKYEGLGLGAGATRSAASTDRIKLTLTPTNPNRLGTKPVASDRLASAIVQMARDAREVPTRMKGAFRVQEFEVALDIELSREGGLHLIFVRHDASASHHTLTLRFRPV